MPREEPGPRPGLQVAEDHSGLAADRHRRPRMARPGGDHGGRPPVPLGVAIELEPPPAPVLVYRLEDVGLNVALQAPPGEARDGAAELVAGHPPPLLAGEIIAEILRRVGGTGGRPEEADRLAVGREPEVEGRAPPALQLQARPIRVAEILDQDRLGMAAGEGQEVARWAERRRADQAEDAVAADEIAVGHRPELHVGGERERIDHRWPVAHDPGSQSGAVCRDRDEFDSALGRHRRQFQRVALEPIAEVEPPQVPALRADEDPLAVRADGHGVQRVATGPDGFLDSSRDVPHADGPLTPDGYQALAVRAERKGPDVASVARQISPLTREDPARELRQGPEDDASIASAGGQELAVRAEGQALDGVHVADGLGVVVGRR